MEKNEIIWVFVIVALLFIVVLASGIFYFSFAFASPTGHVVSGNEEIENAEISNDGFVEEGDFRYKVNELFVPLVISISR